MDEENLQTTNPFYSEWSWFGFNGKPSPGFDYSWFEVQNYLELIGCEEYLLNCKLFSSSRNSNIFMIRTQNGDEEIWDISDVTFNYLTDDKTTLVASFNDRCIHISNVSTSFIELLIKAQKLAFDSLSNFNPFNPIPFKMKILPEQIKTPEDASKVDG